jgi:hypothetical protein
LSRDSAEPSDRCDWQDQAVRYSLGLDTSHLQGLTRSPLTGVIELIWNAIDADAKTIEVDLLRTEMDSVHGIVVRDDGHGITPQVATEHFAKLAGSWKATTAKSPGGRPLHGRAWRGSAAAVANET